MHVAIVERLRQMGELAVGRPLDETVATQDRRIELVHIDAAAPRLLGPRPPVVSVQLLSGAELGVAPGVGVVVEVSVGSSDGARVVRDQTV